jgi:deazaflavin-dependent oxidoreductase (nitroreductase family)
MPDALRYVDPHRQRSWFTRAYSWLVSTRPMLAMSRLIGWKLDPLLLRATGGRLGTALTIPTAVLETTGAKSGTPRRHAVIYFHDGDRVTIVASRAGGPNHPAWYDYLVAHPDVTFGGIPMRASVVRDEAERQRLWSLADRVFAPFAKYRRQAAATGREIPLVQLTRAAP